MPTTSLEAVEAEAMKLSPRERADLADRLWMSVEADEDHDAAWDAEIRRRMAEVDSGAVTCRPWSEAMQELRLKYS
jgi:putative addiction module component (TIGR02574 family)